MFVTILADGLFVFVLWIAMLSKYFMFIYFAAHSMVFACGENKPVSGLKLICRSFMEANIKMPEGADPVLFGRAMAERFRAKIYPAWFQTPWNFSPIQISAYPELGDGILVNRGANFVDHSLVPIIEFRGIIQGIYVNICCISEGLVMGYVLPV